MWLHPGFLEVGWAICTAGLHVPFLSFNILLVNFKQECARSAKFKFSPFKSLSGVSKEYIFLCLCHGYIKALHIIRKSRTHELCNTTVNITGLDVHPFSFFNKIVLSEKTLTHPNLEIIVAHEKIHVNEKHTLDILFTEILFILQWFNPFAWLIKDAVNNNLEYKVDAHIAKTTNVKAYQLAMVTLADKKGVAPFLTALNGSQLRTRIIMMKRPAVNKYATLKKLAVLPLLAVLVMGLANREVRTEVLPGQEDQTSLYSMPQEETTTGKIIQENDESLQGETISNKDRQNESGSE